MKTRTYATALLALLTLALPAALDAQEASIFDEIETEIESETESTPKNEMKEKARLPFDLSANFLGALGFSDHRGEDLETLQGGGHDPKRRGFNLQQLELGAFGEMWVSEASEIKFSGLAYVVLGEDYVELEEVSGTFSGLPFGLEVEFGHFLTEFGLYNPQHPHAWGWTDQNLALTRILGPEGMRGVGIRAAIHHKSKNDLELGFHFGVQDAFGEAMSSFGGSAEHDHGDDHEDEEETGVGGSPLVEAERHGFGDFVFLNRGTLGFVATSNTDLEFGYSALFGPNRSGLSADTFVWGVDFRATFYADEKRKDGSPKRIADIQFEALGRRYDAESFLDEGDPLNPLDDVTVASRNLEDYGLYLQGRYWLSDDWAIGLRLEWADASGQTFDHDVEALVDPSLDPLRDRRTRISPMVQWSPTQNLRIRGQYNYDEAQHLSRSSASSFWFSLEYTFSTAKGAH